MRLFCGRYVEDRHGVQEIRRGFGCRTQPSNAIGEMELEKAYKATNNPLTYE